MGVKNSRYPIRYAIMPIKEQTGWYHGLHELEQKYDIVANIVAKCYLINEIKEYSSDKTFKIKYEVVFLYDVQYDNFEQVVPQYNIHSHQCINSIFVNQLFYSFEEAQVVANQENKKILDRTINKLFYKEDFQKQETKEKHQETIDRYKQIETIIEQETLDMKITKPYSSSLEDIIKRIVEIPSEFYIKLANALSIEERDYLKQLIENRCCDNCTNFSCGIENCEKVGLDRFGKPQGNNCLGWNNNELIGKQMILLKDLTTK